MTSTKLGRSGRGTPLWGGMLFLLVTLAALLLPATRPHAQPQDDDGHDPHAQTGRQLRDADSYLDDNVIRSPGDYDRRSRDAEYLEPERRYDHARPGRAHGPTYPTLAPNVIPSRPAAAVEHRSRRSTSGGAIVLTIFGVLLLLALWRRPGERPSPAARALVSHSCGRCGRVVDLPRDRAARRLFCPRCGTTLRSDG